MCESSRSILDHRGCADLEKILVRFGAPVSEERAWALCYSTVQCYFQLDCHEKSNCALVSSLSHLILHKDGYVHPETFIVPTGCIVVEGATAGKRRDRHPAESKMVSELGWVLYSALDYGLGNTEERELSPSLHSLIEQMTSADCERGEADDEGIERDLGRTYSLKDALQECEKRLTSQSSTTITGGGAANKIYLHSSTTPPPHSPPPPPPSSSIHSENNPPDPPSPSSSPSSPSKILNSKKSRLSRENSTNQIISSVPISPPPSPCNKSSNKSSKSNSSSISKSEMSPCEHYKAVIRAFVTEAQDLQQFLATVAEGRKYLKSDSHLLSSQYDLDQLQCTDWAVLWKQVMLQLREGVKLKKIDYSKTPLEYTLTPYEMLMEDIRSRRYTLNKVMVNGDIPQKVKKDAHSIILDFIRSRPPLKKASERRLAPIQRVSSPMELLLESIRKDQNLKHVSTPARPKAAIQLGKVTENPTNEKHKKKLIPAPRITLDMEDSDTDDDLSDIPPSSPQLGGTRSLVNGGSAPPTMRRSKETSGGESGGSNRKSMVISRMAYDLVTYSTPNGSSVDPRRHSICVCENPALRTPSVCSNSDKNTDTTEDSNRLSLHRPLSNTSSSASNYSASDSPAAGNSPAASILTSHSQSQRDFLRSAHFASQLDCLSLTLEEVVHIRNVLTKADLEALPLDLTIKEDVAKGKVCFLCMKVRFSFFGSWAVPCKLCKRNVCKKCVSKMRIPTEHFGNIPVLMLTPQVFATRDDEEESNNSYLPSLLPRQLFGRLQEQPKSCDRAANSVGSAPSSPNLSTRGAAPQSLQFTPDSPPYVHHDIKRLPVSCSAGLRLSLKRLFTKRRESMGEETPCVTPEVTKQELRNQECTKLSSSGANLSSAGKDNLRGELMSVCGDCKAMVLNVLLSIKLRRDQAQRSINTPSPPPLHHKQPPRTIRHNLHLNLTPVYN